MERDGGLYSHQVPLTLSAVIFDFDHREFMLVIDVYEAACDPGHCGLAGKEQVSKAMKGEKAGGIYFPITAVQVVPSRLPFP